MIRKIFKKISKPLATIILFFFLPSMQFNIGLTSPLQFHPSTDSQADQLFGYSLSTLETDSESFLVGAPKSVNQEGVATGHVYRCHVGQGSCRRIEGTFSSYKEETSSRGEMFGSSIVQLGRNQIVACAPSYKVNGSSADKAIVSYGRYPTGECYSGNETHFQTLHIPMRLFYSNSHECSHAQLGTSIHKNRNNDVILGAPGFSNWKGGVFILRNSISKQTNCSFNTFADGNQHFSYFGYSVTSLNVPNATYFAVGGPRWEGKGQVIYFYLKGHCEMNFRKDLKNEEFGSYFGHSVTRLDLEGDGFDELVVGAPFSNQSLGDEGRVYVYKAKALEQANKYTWELMSELKGGSVEGGRYGWIMRGVGDVDLDGFEDLLVSAPLEGSGMAYLHYGGQEGYDDSRVQKFPFGVPSSFSSIEGSNGYPNILAGISEANSVLLFKTRPVHSIQINMSLPEVSWSLHSCSLHENVVHAVAHVDIKYSIPQKEFQINQYKNVIKDLHYKVTIDKRGFVELEDNLQSTETRSHEIEGVMDFISSTKPGSLSIAFRLSFPYKKIPDNVKTPMKMTFLMVESDRKSGPMLKKSQQKEFSIETTFKRKCFTETCKPELNFVLEPNMTPLTLGYNQVSIVRGVIRNKGEAIFNTNFTFTHPRWTFLKSVITKPSCFKVECRRLKLQRNPGYFEEECTASEALMKTGVEVVFLLGHSIIQFDDSTEDKVMFESSSAFFVAFYNSHLTAINTSSDSAPLHKTPAQSTFSTTHLYDVRTNATHPSFTLAIQEPFGSFEDDVCCHNTKIKIEFRDGNNETELPPHSNKVSQKSSLAAFLNNTMKKENSIHLSCRSCDPLTFPISSLNHDQSIDVAITTEISGKLLVELQKSKSFSFHTFLLLTPGKVTASRKFFNSFDFNATTEVYEVISQSSAPTEPATTPIWLVLLCICLGIIAVLALVLLLRKCGFFKREKHEYLIESKRKSKPVMANEEGKTDEQLASDHKESELVKDETIPDTN